MGRGEKLAGDDEEIDAVQYYAMKKLQNQKKQAGGRRLEVFKSSKTYGEAADQDEISAMQEENYGSLTHEQKLELVTNDNGSVNLSKLRQLEKKHGVAPLERIDHSKVAYQPFTKNFYAESTRMEEMNTD